MVDARRVRGDAAEELACGFLSEQGWRIVERNYSWRGGEIDIIAERGEVMAFCEVRSRTALDFVTPEETVNRAKQRKIILTARRYLQDLEEQGEELKGCRFDVISVFPDRAGQAVRHIEEAFSEAD
jgi:putative endonuclease